MCTLSDDRISLNVQVMSTPRVLEIQCIAQQGELKGNCHTSIGIRLTDPLKRCIPQMLQQPFSAKYMAYFVDVAANLSFVTTCIWLAKLMCYMIRIGPIH